MLSSMVTWRADTVGEFKFDFSGFRDYQEGSDSDLGKCIKEEEMKI